MTTNFKVGGVDMDDTYLSKNAIWLPGQRKTLWAIGNNGNGQLGLGNTNPQTTVVQSGTQYNWATLTTTRGSTLAIKTDGTLWSWGENSTGQLGLGDTTTRTSPTQVGTLNNWSKVSGGVTGHILAIKTDGTLWSWGQNSFGELGHNDVTYKSSPVQVGSMNNWSKVSAGSTISLAIKTDGTLWSWGENSNGQLGLGNDTTRRSSPTQVGSLTSWTQVSGRSSSVAAIKTDGTLWTWGYNQFGELGLGTSMGGSYKSSPNQVGTLTNWQSVAAGGPSMSAIKTDGTLWSWGQNYNGSLGTSDSIHRSSPVQVGTLTNWYTASSGYNCRSAIKTDGTLWYWGSIQYIGSTSSPIQVGTSTSWTLADANDGFIMGIQVY